jgi:hypothetical protein
MCVCGDCGRNAKIIILVKVKEDGLGIILQRNNLLMKMMTK